MPTLPPPAAGTATPAVVVLLLIAMLVGAFLLADPSPSAPVTVPVVVTNG